MIEKEDILKKAIDDVKQTLIPSGPPKELVDTTLEKLNHVSSQLKEEHIDKQVVFTKRFMIINNLLKAAAAVIFLIAVGYTAGRFSAPRSPDMEQIQAALEPAIRVKLLREMTQYIQIGLAGNYVQLKEELTEQYQNDLQQAALEILNTSSTITNNLLEELIQSIATAQVQNRQWVAAALEQTEQNRLADKTVLGNVFLNFASQTTHDLQQTKQNVAVLAKYLADTNIDNPNLKETENSNN
jgi:hypothetical protein